MTESPPSPTPLAPFLIHNFIVPFFIYTHNFKLLTIIRNTIIYAVLFFFKIIQSFILYALIPNSKQNHTSSFESDSDSDLWVPFLKGSGQYNETETGDGSLIGDTCIARALHQLLAILNEIPVSSRKYEIVRSYAEKLMDENLKEGYEPLRRVNTTVLSDAFSRALGQLEVAVAVVEDESEGDSGVGVVVKKKKNGYFGLNRVMKTVGNLGDAAWTRFTKRKTRLRSSAEKLSAELLWLAQKLEACGSSDEAVRQWASASKLSSSPLSAHLRLQGSLVKLSVFLFKQAASMGSEDDGVETMEEVRKIKMKMLMSWVPFLCQSSTGTDTPVLSFNEKNELENVLGELIGSLKHEEEQEKVLSLWLHYFSHCPSSDWPNLHLYYDRWCTTSRKLFIHEGK